MNRIFIFCLLVLLGACLSEEKADLAKPSTFMRYFSDGYQNTAVTIEETTSDNGFIILANSVIRNSDAETIKSKILLIKTDQFGNEVWREHYPAIGADVNNYVAHSLLILPSGGFLITGEQVLDAERGKMRVLLINTNDTGNLVSADTIPLQNSTGHASALRPSGNLLVLSSYLRGDSVNVEVTEYNPALAVQWKQTYYQGDTELINRLHYTESLPGGPYFYYGGHTRQNSGTFGGFVARFLINDPTGTGFTQEIGGTSSEDMAGDFCPSGQNFAFVGSTDASGSGDPGDIMFYQVLSDGSPNLSKIYTSEIFNYPAGSTPPTNNKLEVANSISRTSDGDFIILGTIDTYTGVLGAGNTDLFLMKVNGVGGKRWSQTFGSLQADNGSTVRQTLDGGYVVLGTSNFGSQLTILLIKTDKNGDVD